MAKRNSIDTSARMAAIQKTRDELSRALTTQATYQIDAMCHALQTAARAQDTETLPYLVQGIAQRIIDLNDGLMTLSYGFDEDDAITDMSDRLFGQYPDLQPSAGTGA